MLTQNNDMYSAIPSGNGDRIILIDDNLNTITALYDRPNNQFYRKFYYLTSDGTLCFPYWESRKVGGEWVYDPHINIIHENISIKEWYEGVILTQDNCLYQENELISNNCDFYDQKSNAYFTLNEELYIYLKEYGSY